MPSRVIRLLPALPVIGLAIYVAGATPQVPLLDDWTFAEFARQVHAGEAGWREWIAPHNGSHVVLVPRALLTAIAFATGGSGRVVLLASVLLIAWTTFAIVRMGEQSAAADRAGLLRWAQLATALLLCSPASYRAFIWPVAFCHFLVNAAVVTAAWRLARARNGEAMRAALPAMAACAVASLTRADGLASWFVLWPSLWLLTCAAAERRRVLFAWGAAASTCIALVMGSLIGLAPDEAAPLPRDLFAQPVEIVGNALGIIGMPFGVFADDWLGDALPSPRRYFWFGVPVVAAWFGFGVRGLLSADAAVRRSTWAWVAIGGFGGLFAAVTALARVGVLEKDFLGDIWPSNYTVEAALVGVAALQLTALNLPARGVRSPQRVAAFDARRFARLVAAALVLVALLGALVTRGPDALHQRARTRWSGLCWELFAHLAPINTCFVQQPTRAKVRAFEQTGFRVIRDDVQALPAPRPHAGAAERVVAVERTGATRAVEGWARAEEDAARPIVFIELVAFPGLFAPADVSAPEGGRARWSAPLPPLEHAVAARAWVYQREKGRLVRLAGDVAVPPDRGPGYSM